MAFKTFTNGSVLTDADLNNFLMKQTVVTCTSGTRPASPPEGMCIYETDTDKLMVYNASWREFSRANAAQGSATMNAGFTATKNFLFLRGSFVWMQITFNRSTSMAAVTSYVIGSVPGGYLPGSSYDFYGFSNQDNIFACGIDTGTGNISVRPYTAVTASIPVVLNTMWVLS